MSQRVTLDWRGPQVLKAVLDEVVIPALQEIGLRVESEAKQQLYKGHGVLTGTLRRSIHTAPPGYPWARDNVPPSTNAPERGGKAARPERTSRGVVVEVGSGLSYAIWVHQGHGAFEGYHYLTNAVEKVRPLVPSIVRQHRG